MCWYLECCRDFLKSRRSGEVLGEGVMQQGVGTLLGLEGSKRCVCPSFSCNNEYVVVVPAMRREEAATVPVIDGMRL